MITGPKRLFEQRCRDRGYSLDEVMGCVVSKDGDQWTVDPNHHSYPTGGPGRELELLLHKFFLRPSEGCGCQERAMEMNAMGPQWCRDNMDLISSWLAEAAREKGLPYFEAVGRMAIERAISNWEKKEMPNPAEPQT